MIRAAHKYYAITSNMRVNHSYDSTHFVFFITKVVSLRRNVSYFESNTASRDSAVTFAWNTSPLLMNLLSITFSTFNCLHSIASHCKIAYPLIMSGNVAPFASGLELKTYRDWNGVCQWHTLVFYNNGFSWWIKVSLQGKVPDFISSLGYLKRRSAFQGFLRAIDFRQLQLLDDTRSNIVLTMTDKTDNIIPMQEDLHHENIYVAIVHRMRFEIMEDNDRVIYPPTYQVQGLRSFDAGCLQDPEMIAPAVSTITLNHQKFIYKTIDRPIYESRDTKDIINEINALAQFRGAPNIAQLVGLVESENPYKTSPSKEMPRVITGFLLEYYSRGPLDGITSEDIAVTDHLRILWAIQVGKALELLHSKGRPHLDIKPSNVVLDKEQNAFLIDIGGSGCYTWEWLSPEMQVFIEENPEKTPVNACMDIQVATDCWAYGKLLSFIATNYSPGGTISDELRVAGDKLTKLKPETRTTLSDTLSILNELFLHDPRKKSIGTGVDIISEQSTNSLLTRSEQEGQAWETCF